MATTYRFLASGQNVELTADLFADGVEVNSDHRLSNCISYQWYRNNGLINFNLENFSAIDGATASTYNVSLGDISNSGEYYCEIIIGKTNRCNQRTEIRRITIIECVGTASRTLPATGASDQLIIRHPHYEVPVFNAEGNDWIIGGDLEICDTQTTNVCQSVQNFTLRDQLASENQARRGQPTLTIGNLSCFYNLIQDFIRTQADSGRPPADTPAGPFINLSQNGPAVVNNSIRVTATVGTTEGTGTETYEVSFNGGAFAAVDANNMATFDISNNVVGTMVVTAVVRDNNMLETTETITLEWVALTIPSPTNPTTITGAQFPRVDWNIFQFGNPTIMPGRRMVDAFFGVEGAGRWQYTVSFNQGFFGTPVETGRVQFTVSGPGVNSTTTVSVGEAPVTVEFPAGTTGTYRYQLDIDVDDEMGQLITYPSGSVSLLPINF